MVHVVLEKRKNKVIEIKKHRIIKIEQIKLAEALIHVAVISLILITFAYFYSSNRFIGLILIGLGFLPLISLKLAKHKIKETISEIVFGIANTGLVTLFALFGFKIIGIFGAIIGVAIGDSITEGFSGILEGEVAEILKRYKIREKINPLNSSLGKMAGALFGGGIVLLLFSITS